MGISEKPKKNYRYLISGYREAVVYDVITTMGFKVLTVTS
jgi:hypothetical protein